MKRLLHKYFYFFTSEGSRIGPPPIWVVLIFLFLVGGGDSWGQTKKDFIPPLNEALELALELNASVGSGTSSRPAAEVIFLVKKYYYQIQTQLEQLDTAEEVRGHFEKAVNKSEEKLESGEGEVSQSAVTKLKLGLSGTKNDIIGLKHDMRVARLSLGRLIGRELAPDSETAGRDVLPVEFAHKSYEDFLNTLNLSFAPKSDSGQIRPASSPSTGRVHRILDEVDGLALQKAYLAVEEAKEKMELGKQNRRITRALLVAEVANYDFGIGDSGDLFEALIIYTRVLTGYYDSIFKFNLAVAELDKIAALAVEPTGKTE